MARLIALTLACLLPAVAAQAQKAAAPAPAPTAPAAAAAPAGGTAEAGKLTLELNGTVDTEAGACRLTVVTTNNLSQGLKRAAWQVAIFDDKGLVQALPVLDFGAMIAGKTKVAMFEIPGRKCGQISRIVVNDVAQCEGESGTDLRDACLTGLATRSRGDIDLGL